MKKLVFLFLFLSSFIFAQHIPLNKRIINRSKGYATLYQQKVKTNKGKEINHFYWIKTTSSGKVITKQPTPINGKFFNSSAALNNIPSNYQLAKPLVAPLSPPLDLFDKDLLDIIEANPDVSNNTTYGLRSFKDNGNPKNTNTLLLLGDMPEFLDNNGETGLLSGIATGFGSPLLYNKQIDGIYQWVTLLGDQGWDIKTPDAAYRLGKIEYGAVKGRTKNARGQNVRVDYYMVDTEDGVWWNYQPNIPHFIRGFMDAAKADGRTNFNYLYYGCPINNAFMFPYSGNWYKSLGNEASRIFPSTSGNDLTQLLKKRMEFVRHPNVKYDILTQYPKHSLPLKTSMYDKLSNGSYRLVNGRRVLTPYEFEENVRGVNYRWNNAQPGKGLYKSVHSLHWAINQIYGLYGSTFYRLKMIAKEQKLTVKDVHKGEIGTYGLLRSTCESNEWSNKYRPLDAYTMEMSGWMVFMMTNNLTFWSGWALTQGWSVNGIFPARREGEPLARNDIEGGNKDGQHVNLGVVRQGAGIKKAINILNAELGLFAKTDEILLFTEPDKFHENQIMVMCRKNSRGAFFVAFDPRMDVGESLPFRVMYDGQLIQEGTVLAKKCLKMSIEKANMDWSKISVWYKDIYGVEHLQKAIQ